MAPAFEDARLYRAGSAIESLIAERDGSPFWAQAPSLAGASTGEAAN
jgi:aspartyl-tRNA(Asn)/glutamyl-tRNA(Gln) amidotransferase subunit A